MTLTVIATLSMLVANRLVPADLPARAAMEEGMFWISWLVAFAFARLAHRSRATSAYLTGMARAVFDDRDAGFSGGVVELGHHRRSFACDVEPRLLAVAGVDLVMLIGGVGALLPGLRLKRRELDLKPVASSGRNILQPVRR